MKSVFFRICLILTVLLIAAAALPVAAESDDIPAEAGAAAPEPVKCEPWWERCPPVVVKTRTRVVVRQPETLIESIPAEGWCYTAIKKVNVRSQPSIYATKVFAFFKPIILKVTKPCFTPSIGLVRFKYHNTCHHTNRIE